MVGNRDEERRKHEELLGSLNMQHYTATTQTKHKKVARYAIQEKSLKNAGHRNDTDAIWNKNTDDAPKSHIDLH